MRRLSVLVALLVIAPVARARGADDTAAPEPPPLPPVAIAASDRPTVSAERIEQVAEGELLLTGHVELRYGELKLLADTVRFNDTTHMVHAEGNVVLIVGQGEITGDRLEMNVETKRATVWNARGYMDPDVVFDAAKVERISDEKVVVTDATVTTCTQPTPYWAFHVSSATLELDRYAHMRNVTIKTGKAHVFYLPYLMWPMKRERASGILLPNVGYSRTRGSFIGNAIYFTLGRSQDITAYIDLYGRTGTGLGFEYRFVPSALGHGTFTGYYLDDTVSGEQRYRFRLEETQRFRSGFRILTLLNKVSDLDYYLDFERDITQNTSPAVLSTIHASNNWSFFSLNARLERIEQFLTTDATQLLQRLPQVELRARGIRLGQTPFYLSFDSSAALLNREQNFEDPNGDPFGTEATYSRFDLSPSISASFSPAPWLDISPSIGLRETYYTRGLEDPNNPLEGTTSEPVAREFAAFNVQTVGPRFFRILGDAHDPEATVYKHTFEPRASYSYVPRVQDGERVIPFDEVDTVRGDINQVTYGLTSRLFAKRPANRPPEAPSAAGGEPYASDIVGPTQIQVPVVDEKDLPPELRQMLKDVGRAPGVGVVEVATFDLTQSYSFDDDAPLTRASVLNSSGFGTELESAFGPIVGSVRFNPTAAASVNFAVAYDITHDDISSVSLSSDLRSLQRGYLRFSWFLNRDLNGRFVDPDGNPADPNDPLSNGSTEFFDTSQIRILGGTSFLRRKVTLDVEGSYDIINRDLRDRRYRLGYNTQCCGMMVEFAQRDFETVDEVEYRFLLNLRGVGTFLDLQGRPR